MVEVLCVRSRFSTAHSQEIFRVLVRVIRCGKVTQSSFHILPSHSIFLMNRGPLYYVSGFGHTAVELLRRSYDARK